MPRKAKTTTAQAVAPVEEKAVETKAVEVKETETKVEAPAVEAPVAEAKPERKKTSRKPAAKKVEEKPVEEKPAAKKPAEKKTATRKPAAKKAELQSEVSVQYSGKSYSQEELVKIAKDVWQYDLNQKVEDLKSCSLYVKPEENAVYYVMNEDVTGYFAI